MYCDQYCQSVDTLLFFQFMAEYNDDCIGAPEEEEMEEEEEKVDKLEDASVRTDELILQAAVDDFENRHQTKLMRCGY